MKLLTFFVTLLSTAFVGFAQSGSTQSTAKAIICLTYDDALPSQLSVAIPQLDSFGLKATFFLTSLQGTSGQLGKGSPAPHAWQKAAKNGHELGNHTLFHPCPEKFGWQKEVAIENYTVDKMLKEIELANAYLQQIDQSSKPRSYAYPCNVVEIGGVDYSKKLKELNIITVGRDGGDKKSIVVNFGTLNIMRVPSWHVQEGTKLEELIAFAEQVKTVKGLGVYQLHDIGGPLFNISPNTHYAFLKYLKDNEKDFIVTTFSQAMELVEQRKRSQRSK